MNRPRRVATLHDLGKIQSQVMRLYCYVSSAAWVCAGGTGTYHGPKFTVTCNMTSLSSDWTRRKAIVTGLDFVAIASKDEVEKQSSHSVKVKTDSNIVVSASRSEEGADTVRWGPKEHKYEDALRALQRLRRNAKEREKP